MLRTSSVYKVACVGQVSVLATTAGPHWRTGETRGRSTGPVRHQPQPGEADQAQSTRLPSESHAVTTQTRQTSRQVINLMIAGKSQRNANFESISRLI